MYTSGEQALPPALNVEHIYILYVVLQCLILTFVKAKRQTTATGTRVNSRKRHDDDTPAAPVSPAQSLTSFPARTVPSQLPSEGSSALKPQRGDQKQAGGSLLHPRRRVEPSRNSILLLLLLLHRDAQFQCGGGKVFNRLSREEK